MTKPIVTDPISADLKRVMRQLKLGRMLDTLPDRLTLARQQHLSHAAFLELVLADEATRRDTSSAARRARDAGLDAAMRLDTWNESAAVRYDRTLWTDLTSLRFLDGPHGALLLGAVVPGSHCWFPFVVCLIRSRFEPNAALLLVSMVGPVVRLGVLDRMRQAAVGVSWRRSEQGVLRRRQLDGQA